MDYKPARLDFSKSQLEKAIKGKPVRLHSTQLNKGNNVILLHPTNYKLIEKALKSNKGITLYLAPGEIKETMDSQLEGTGIFDWIKDKAWPWLKKNYQPLIKPILSTAADFAASKAGPQGALARKLLKETTGVGLKKPKPKGKGLYLSKGKGLYL